MIIITIKTHKLFIIKHPRKSSCKHVADGIEVAASQLGAVGGDQGGAQDDGVGVGHEGDDALRVDLGARSYLEPLQCLITT